MTDWVILLTSLGLVGSTEWVEEYITWAVPNVVAYLNVDVAVSGKKFTIEGVPELHDIIQEVMKKVPAPNNSSKTLYDDWIDHAPDYSPDKRYVGVLGSGSDYTAFVHSGIASVRAPSPQM